MKQIHEEKSALLEEGKATKETRMENRIKKAKRFLAMTLIVLLIGAALYFILPVSAPILLAFLTATFLESIIRWCTGKLNMRRSLAILITYLLFITVFGALGYIFVSKVITQAIHIAEKIPYYSVVISEQWQKWNDSILAASEQLPLSLVNEITHQLDGTLDKMIEPLKRFDYLDFAKSLVTKIPLFLISVLVYLIALFLFMVEMPDVSRGFYNHLKDETAAKVRYMLSKLSDVVFGFMKAQLLVSLIIFAVSLIGLLILSPRVALLMAFVIWIIDVIPIIGSIVIVGPWALVELMQGNTYLGTGLVILAIVLLIIRRTVEPKVMGEYIGLSPLATLISMFIGAKLLGLLGFIVGPLLLIAFRTAREVSR